MDTEGTIESVHIKRVEFRENVRAFFPQGQSKLSGVRKAGIDCIITPYDSRSSPG